MSVYIKIDSCNDCPHKKFKSTQKELKDIHYLPVCRLANKELEYKIVEVRDLSAAYCPGDIPVWCPLHETKPENTI